MKRYIYIFWVSFEQSKTTFLCVLPFFQNCVGWTCSVFGHIISVPLLNMPHAAPSFPFFPLWQQTQHHRERGAADVMFKGGTEIKGFMCLLSFFEIGFRIRRKSWIRWGKNPNLKKNGTVYTLDTVIIYESYVNWLKVAGFKEGVLISELAYQSFSCP